MSRTATRTFDGPARLTPKKLAWIKQDYVMSQADADKSSTIEDAEYNQGRADAHEETLEYLHYRPEVGFSRTTNLMFVGLMVWVVGRHAEELIEVGKDLINQIKKSHDA